ncbi:hypothetical protein E2C01_077397 [Portunus trituberculatus]|uniref:Uncharacterized protein n=1 Tax=Portunus trituberculatus TaxID=210409 RepID=A0A5B7IM63_PORTR|nr:hypothetical protein [Portunus trituberculatus]
MYRRSAWPSVSHTYPAALLPSPSVHYSLISANTRSANPSGASHLVHTPQRHLPSVRRAYVQYSTAWPTHPLLEPSNNPQVMWWIHSALANTRFYMDSGHSRHNDDLGFGVRPASSRASRRRRKQHAPQ